MESNKNIFFVLRGKFYKKFRKERVASSLQVLEDFVEWVAFSPEVGLGHGELKVGAKDPHGVHTSTRELRGPILLPPSSGPCCLTTSKLASDED